MKYWTNAVARMYELPIRTSVKVAEIYVNVIVETEGNTHAGFLEVFHNGKRGWIAETLAEPYNQGLPKDCIKIDNQTPDLKDFEQYFLFRGLKQVNACGELCICFALGLTMADFMNTWEVTSPKLFKQIMGTAMRMSGTYKTDLAQMCEAYAVDTEYLETMTLDPYLKRSRYTPGLLQYLAEKGYPIVGCKMDANTGRLRGSGIGHWVLITKVIPERNGYGIVELYNPAPNRIEQYSWQEFIATAPQPTGIWIPKE